MVRRKCYLLLVYMLALPVLVALILLMLPAPACALTLTPDPQAAPGAQTATSAQAAPDPGALIAKQFGQLNLQDMEGYAGQVDSDLQAQLSDFSLVKTLESIRSGQLKLDPKSLLQALAKVFFQES